MGGAESLARLVLDFISLTRVTYGLGCLLKTQQLPFTLMIYNRFQSFQRRLVSGNKGKSRVLGIAF